MNATPRFSLYDNGGKTVDRYTLVDRESADILNGETYMQCTSFSVDFDSPLGVISHDVIYPEDLHLLWDCPFPPDVPKDAVAAMQRVKKAYYS